MIAALFYHPVQLTFYSQLWLLLPLCAAVAIVYKTIRIVDLGRLWIDLAYLMGYMVGGLVLLCVGLWLVHSYWP